MNDSRKKRHSIVAYTWMWALTCALFGCDAPEIVQPPKNNADAHAPTYEFDVVLLSEFAGNLLPAKRVISVYVTDDDYYYLPEEIAMVTPLCSGSADSQAPEEQELPSPHPLPDSLKARMSQDRTQFELKPLNYGDGNVTCIKKKELTSTFAECKACADKTSGFCAHNKVTEYDCTYYASGAPAINQLWRAFAKKTNEDMGQGVQGDASPYQIRTSNGDSFGASPKYSAFFNDDPVPMTLNLMNFDLDAFGNHNFDVSVQYISELVKISNYYYLGTNLINATKVFHNLNVAPFSLVDIPAKDDPEHNGPLRVAFISALDPGTFEKIYPGRLGSLGITDDYCPVIQAIEKAYNLNARAFFITAHTDIKGEGLKDLYNALYSFRDHAYYPADDDAIASALEQGTVIPRKCTSLLAVPNHRLPENLQSDNLKPPIDINGKEYQEKLAEMHREIFDGIIGVFGDSNATPGLTPFRYDEKTTPANNPCGEAPSKPNESIAYCSDQITIGEYVEQLNVLKKDKNYDRSPFCNDEMQLFNTNIDCYHYENGQTCDNGACLENESSTHTIPFLQYYAWGFAGERIKISVNKTAQNDAVEQDNVEHGIAAAYRADIKSLDIVPTLSSPEFALSSGDKFNYFDFTPDSCETLFKELEAEASLDNCKALYFEIDNKNNLQNIAEYIADSPTGLELYDKCKSEIINYSNKLLKLSEEKNVIHNASQNETEIQMAIDRLSAMWTCYYKNATLLTCGEGTGKAFVEPVIFKFDDNLTFSTKTFENDRNMDTFRNCLAGNSILYDTEINLQKTDFFHVSDEDEDRYFDIAIFNAGAQKSKKGSVGNAEDATTYTRAWVDENYTFGNTTVSITANVQEVVSTLEAGLASPGGSWPVIAGAVGFYTYENDKPVIQELWKVDRFGALIKPIFIRLKDNEPACSGQCQFADYDLKDKENRLAKVTLSQEPGDLEYAYGRVPSRNDSDKDPSTRLVYKLIQHDGTTNYKIELKDYTLVETGAGTDNVQRYLAINRKLKVLTNDYMHSRSLNMDADLTFRSTSVNENMKNYLSRVYDKDIDMCALAQNQKPLDMSDLSDAASCMFQFTHWFFVAQDETPYLSRWLPKHNADKKELETEELERINNIYYNLNETCTPEKFHEMKVKLESK